MAITDKQILKKAEAFSDKRDLEENRHMPAIQRHGLVEGYQKGYKDCLDDNKVKFHRQFEDLYNVAIAMADTCVGAKMPEERFSKLEEEYHELIEAFDLFKDIKTNDQGQYMEALESLLDEMGDVLFVLLHIAHRIMPGTTAFSLLHGAMSKMLARMNDQDYQAKN